MVKRVAPEIVEIVDATDHAAGSSRSISALVDVRKTHANSTVRETSPYLRQHAENPLIGIQGEEKRFAEPEKRTSDVRPGLAKHVAPLGWEHIGLTGDYVWSSVDQPAGGSFRPLRRRDSMLAA